MTYGNGDTVSYEYDNYGGISRKILSDEVGADKPVTYYYTYLIDGEGRPIYEKDSMSGEKTTYQYDFKGNLVGERVYNTLSYTYANQLYEINNNFDDDGNIIKNALQTQVGTLTTNYAYDAESGLPSSVTLFGGRQVEYDYDAEGVLTRRILSTNTDVNELFSYDENGLISTHKIGFITESENAETGETEEEFVGDEYTYTYDENYNITEIKKGDTVQQSYEYDALNQLIRENDRDTGKTVVYEYDNYGNIEKKTEYAFTLGELGTAVDTVDYAYTDSAWKDKLTSYDGQEITYDAIGNPTDYMGADMTWLGRQMMSYSIENEIDISYTYDADGLRTSKTVNGVKHNYYYVDGQLRYERNGDSYEIYYTYDADGRPVLATKRDLVAKKNYQYYLITNTRGDIIETRNGDGNVNAKFVYDAWGKLVSVTDANGNALSTDSFAYQISLKYRGYVYDNETGLYYLQSRYYDPETGRFLNADDDLLNVENLKAYFIKLFNISKLYADNFNVFALTRKIYFTEEDQMTLYVLGLLQRYDLDPNVYMYDFDGEIYYEKKLYYLLNDKAIYRVNYYTDRDETNYYGIFFYYGTVEAWDSYFDAQLSKGNESAFYNFFASIIFNLAGTFGLVASLLLGGIDFIYAVPAFGLTGFDKTAYSHYRRYKDEDNFVFLESIYHFFETSSGTIATKVFGNV